MCALAPGENKILIALKGGEKRFKDLYETCVKNPTLLATYLKHLQKLGLIWRNTDTRRYQLQIPGWESLYLAEITALIEQYGLRRENRELFGFEVIVSSEDKNLKHITEAIHSNTTFSKKIRKSFSMINQFLFLDWKKQVLACFGENERQKIEEYERAFHEVVLFTIPPEKRISKEHARSLAENQLKRRYPGIEIPTAMLELEAESIFRKTMENEMKAAILEIGNPTNLLRLLRSSNHLPSEEKIKLKPLMECLMNSDKVNLYNRYMNSLGACPKTLIIFSSSAFNCYLKKQWQHFPEEEEVFKKKHPWLYSQIQTL